MTRLLTMALAFGALLANGLLAHDAKLHQSNATTGQVTAIAKDSFDLKTDKGNFKVTYSSTTVFQHGGTKVDPSRLTKGAKVGVIGTKLPTGELVAKEVLLNVDEAAGHDKAPAKTKNAEHAH